jgi:hypothetical protein
MRAILRPHASWLHAHTKQPSSLPHIGRLGQLEELKVVRWAPAGGSLARGALLCIVPGLALQVLCCRGAWRCMLRSSSSSSTPAKHRFTMDVGEECACDGAACQVQ